MGSARMADLSNQRKLILRGGRFGQHSGRGQPGEFGAVEPCGAASGFSHVRDRVLRRILHDALCGQPGSLGQVGGIRSSDAVHDAQDAIAVGLGIGQALEQQHGHALAGQITIGMGRVGIRQAAGQVYWYRIAPDGVRAESLLSGGMPNEIPRAIRGPWPTAGR